MTLIEPIPPLLSLLAEYSVTYHVVSKLQKKCPIMCLIVSHAPQLGWYPCFIYGTLDYMASFPVRVFLWSLGIDIVVQFPFGLSSCYCALWEQCADRVALWSAGTVFSFSSAKKMASYLYLVCLTGLAFSSRIAGKYIIVSVWWACDTLVYLNPF